MYVTIIARDNWERTDQQINKHKQTWKM